MKSDKKNKMNSVFFQQPLNPLLERVYQNQLQYREILLNDEVNEDCIELVAVQIMNFNKEDDEAEAEAKLVNGDEDYKKIYDRNDHPIILMINTYGGLVDDGLSTVAAIKSSKTPVHTIAMGKAMSMGFMILIAGHRRFCQRYSNIMYHQISSGTVGPVGQMSEYTDHVLRRQKMIEDLVTEHTLIPEETLESVYTRKVDLYIDAEEALEWGVVDEII
jgi:ATP-dependent Clp protease, protease subunit